MSSLAPVYKLAHSVDISGLTSPPRFADLGSASSAHCKPGAHAWDAITLSSGVSVSEDEEDEGGSVEEEHEEEKEDSEEEEEEKKADEPDALLGGDEEPTEYNSGTTAAVLLSQLEALSKLCAYPGDVSGSPAPSTRLQNFPDVNIDYAAAPGEWSSMPP